MTEKKIIVSCSFREFDGSEDAKIQLMFLDSIRNQTHKNITLAVTNFHEKTVEKTIAESGLNYVFFQSKIETKYYGIGEVCYNATTLLTPGDSIFLHTSADHIFPPHFFATVAKRIPKMGSVTSFPQKVYDGIKTYEADRSIEDGFCDLRLDRGMLKDIDDTDLPGVFAMDPNHWLPDTVAVDGDLFLQPGACERLIDPRFLQKDGSPGVAQNTLLAFLAKPGKRLNIVMEARYIELLNDYATDPMAVAGAKTYAESRREQYYPLQENWKRLEAYGEEIGLEPFEYVNQPFIKIDQVSLYEPTGSYEQKAAFKAYLELWRLRYLIRARKIELNNNVTDALSHLKQVISLLGNIHPPIAIEQVAAREHLWLYGAGLFGKNTWQKAASIDVKFSGVADSFQRGEWNNQMLLSPEELKAKLNTQDVIVIASEHWKDIQNQLKALGIRNTMYIPLTHEPDANDLLVKKI